MNELLKKDYDECWSIIHNLIIFKNNQFIKHKRRQKNIHSNNIRSKKPHQKSSHSMSPYAISFYPKYPHIYNYNYTKIINIKSFH